MRTVRNALSLIIFAVFAAIIGFGVAYGSPEPSTKKYCEEIVATMVTQAVPEGCR